MHSRESVRSQMNSWWTPALTGYYCEDVPFRTTQNRLLLQKEEICNLKIHKTYVCEEDHYDIPPSKGLDISCDTSRVASDLLNNWQSMNNNDQQSYYLQVFQKLY